ncbi:MAG: efflux transporter outer membrane subunit [Opitutales bacterium]|nr:efflux transporter outer membrane subunit [Opitutales bacterium]
MSKRLISLLSAVVIAGCTTGPDYETPDTALPQAWPDQSILSGDLQADWSEWWQLFGDPTLNQLVLRSLDQNLKLSAQTARVEEFRARLGLARADRLPTLEAQAAASREQTPGATIGIPGFETGPTNLFSVSGMLGYEVDLWGRLAREREAALALFEQSSHARDALRLSIVTDVVTTYFDLRAAENQVRITQDTIDSREQTLELQQIRYDGGDIDELVLQQARSELESARAELPARIQRKRMLEGALAVLIGVQPEQLWSRPDWNPGDLGDIQLPRQIPSFLPSELLERRPDVRASEAGLKAATASIGIAEAARLPRINLSAMLGTAAGSTSNLFTEDAEAWSLAASLSGPIWDFGRSRARIESAEAQAEQAEAQYRMTVLAAFNDVRNALILYDSNSQRVEATRNLVDSLERTEALAKLRYKEGYISFMEFLDTQRALLSARLALEEAVRDQLSATASLFKALGGGWDPQGRES